MPFKASTAAVILLAGCNTPEPRAGAIPTPPQPPTPTSVTILVSSTGGGSVSGAGRYERGTKVTLTAKPFPGYGFVGWRGDASGSSTTFTLTANSAKDISAYFVKIPTTVLERMEAQRKIAADHKQKVPDALAAAIKESNLVIGSRKLVIELNQVGLEHQAGGKLRRSIEETVQDFKNKKQQAVTKSEDTTGATREGYLANIKAIDKYLDELGDLRNFYQVTAQKAEKLSADLLEKLEVYKDTRSVLGEKKAKEALHGFLQQSLEAW